MLRPILFAVGCFVASTVAIELIDRGFRNRENALLAKKLAKQ